MNFNDTSRGSSLATVLGDGNAFTMIEYNGELIAENDKELFESMATDAVSSLDNQNGGGHSVFSIEPDINASHTLALKTNEEVESVALVEENDVKDAENEVGDISVLDEEHDAEDNEEEEGVAEVKDFEEKAKDEDEEEHIEEEQDRRYNQSYDKALVLGELMGYENPQPIGSGGNADVFRVQMIGYSNSTAILKVIETKGTNCSMVDIGSRRDGICELVPLEMVMLEECARQRIESVVKCLQTKRLEDDTGVYFGFLMEDAGPRTISLAEFNAHDRPTLTAAEIQEIFVNVIIALDPLYKLGLYHGDLKEGNILINMDTLEVKIIDLGSCTPMIIPGHRMMGVYRGTNRSPENVRNHYAHNPESEELYALGYLLGELLFRLTAYARRYELDDRLREDYSKFLQCKGGYDGLLLDFFDLVDDDCEMRGIISELYTFRSVAGCEINYAREVTPLNIELVVDESASYNFIDHEGNETTEDVIVYYSLYLNY